MKVAFCTCVTSDYLSFAQATFESLRSTYKGEMDCFSLVVDSDYDASRYHGFEIMDLDEIDIASYGNNLLEVKKDSPTSRFRWMLKPILLNHLLESYDAVFWVDPDLYFFNDTSHISKMLSKYEAVINPHWRSFDPFVNQNAFFNYFYHGLFNGGFLGVSRGVDNLLESWLQMMLWKLEDSQELGILDDQGYIGILPLLSEKAYIIRDRGCNLAAWNKQECRRILVDGQVLINGEHSVKFIHFVPDTIKNILNGKDKFLRPHLRKYMDHLLQLDPKMEKLRSFDINKIKRKTRLESEA